MELDLFWDVGRQLNEKQLSLSGISNSLTESSKFHKMRTFPRQSKRCMLCSINIFLNFEINIWSRHSDVKVFYLMLFPARHIPPKADRCCNQYSSLVIPSTFYYRPPLLPIIPPCCIRGRWHCQHLRKWKWGVFFFLLKFDTGTGTWKCFFLWKLTLARDGCFNWRRKSHPS